MRKIVLTFVCGLVVCVLALAWAPAGSAVAGDKGGNDKVTICHRTGSSTNPYVIITISTNALPAHVGDESTPAHHPAKDGRTDHILDDKHHSTCPTDHEDDGDCDHHE